MFNNAGRNATTWSIGDLSSWDTSNVTDMRYMFDNAAYTTTTTFNIGNLSNWNVCKVLNNNYFSSSNGAGTITKPNFDLSC